MASSSGGDAFEERCKFNVDVEPGLREINSIPCGICQKREGRSAVLLEVQIELISRMKKGSAIQLRQRDHCLLTRCFDA
jgi:hypothetical protein